MEHFISKDNDSYQGYGLPSDIIASGKFPSSKSEAVKGFSPPKQESNGHTETLPAIGVYVLSGKNA